MELLLSDRHWWFVLASVLILLLFLFPARAKGAQNGWEVHGTPEGFRLVSGALSLEIDTARATLRSVVMGDKSFVWANTWPLLQAVLIESQSYDQRTDFISDGRLISGVYAPERVDYSIEGESAEVVIEGALLFPDDDAFDFRLRLIGQAGDPALQAEVFLEPRGTFADRFIREISFAFLWPWIFASASPRAAIKASPGTHVIFISFIWIPLWYCSPSRTRMNGVCSAWISARRCRIRSGRPNARPRHPW